MPVVMTMEWAGVSPEQYDAARDGVRWETEVAEGGIFHVAWFADGSLHVVDVWESPEHFDRFAQERLMPVVEGLGITGEPKVEFHTTHRVFDPSAARAL